MEPAITASIATAIAAALVAYHIAIRQGTFLHPSLQLRVGPHTTRNKYRKPIAVVFGIPRTVCHEYFVLSLPVVLDGGSEPTKSVYIEFSLPPSLDPTRLPEYACAYRWNMPAGCSHRAIRLGGRTLVNFEIPLLRRNHPATLFAVLVIHRDEVSPRLADPKTIPFEELSIQVRAENHRGLEQSFLICSTWSDSPEELQGVAPIVAIGARLRRNNFVIQAKAPGFFFLPVPHQIWMKRLLLCQIKITNRDSKIAISSCDDDGAVYQHMDFLPVQVTKVIPKKDA